MATQPREAAQVRVSVVMPLYNAQEYVEAAVRSVLASDLAAFELLVMDDGSKDRSADIVAAIDDPRIVLTRLPASGGPSRPRNVAIARARAPYVAFLDSDDLLCPDTLSASAEALEANPSAGLTFTDYESIDATGAQIQSSVHADYPTLRGLARTAVAGGWELIAQPQFARALLQENFINTSGVMVRRDLLQAVGPFDESLVYSEDRDLWFRLAHERGALYRRKRGLWRRLRAGSLSFGPQIRNARDRITVLRRERKRWQDRAALRQIDRRIAENLAAIGYEERRGRRLHALAMFARAYAVSPEVRWLRGLVGSVLR
jgi:glycosyltransferase involved in cell wall biosynthesis